MSRSPSICSSESDYFELPKTPVAIPLHIFIRDKRHRSKSDSEGSISTYVTPQQQRRRRQTSHLPHHAARKVSAPPELQAHLGQKPHKQNFLAPGPLRVGRSPKPEASDGVSATELIINLNNTNRLALPEGVHSGSDSGVPSEYSSWALPVGRTLNSSPYEEINSRSISVSLEDIPNSDSLRQIYNSDTDDETMSSPQGKVVTEGLMNPAFVCTEPEIKQQATQRSQQHSPLVVPMSGPTPTPGSGRHSFVRAQTDTSLLTSNNNTLPSAHNQRTRTNSMVLQLNLANNVSGLTNNLPNARSVSMISLNTAGVGNTNLPITYPNLSNFYNNDTQSVYSDAGLNNNSCNPGYFGLSNSTHGSLAGVGYNQPPSFTHVSPNDLHDEDPQPTEPHLKKKWTIDTFCENLSTMYAILLFMIGCVFYVADTFSEEDKAWGEAFNVYLIVVQLLWLGYIHVDVRKYVNTIQNALEDARDEDAKGEPVQLETTADGNYQLRINLPEPRKSFAQHYGFTSGRHGGSLYLKIGAAVFCLGYLIHSGLNLGQKVLYIVEENPAFHSCTCAQDIIMSVLQPFYAFYQLFFIYKYSNLIINRRKRLSRFALMHCISASLLFWVYTIVQETLQAISSKKAHYSHDYLNASSKSSISSVLGYENDSEEDNEDLVGGYGTSAYGLKTKSSELGINYGCGMTTPLTKMINDTTPYLYPFSIEYNILIVGIWILLWENIGRMDRHTHLPSIEITYEDDNTKGITSNLIIYVDCHSSNRGLFAGLLMTVATVISIILFFIFTANDATKQHGLQVNGYSELIIHGIMIVTAILAYFAIRNLDVVKHHVSNVDDILLYICLPCIFLYSVFSMVPAFTYGKPLFVAVSIVQVLQAVIQTALICDGLRRCSNSASLKTKKPGRELITFMVVANVALWLLETFEIKSEDGNYYKYDYYGKEAWTLLSHMTLPLALFYRFHSSVCLVDIWKAGYEMEAEH